MMTEKTQKYRILESLLPKPSEKRLILLTGARQTGKTTLAKLKYPHLRYVNLDAPENREAVRQIATAHWGKDIGNAIIDEAQKEPIVFEKLKYAYDEQAISFSIILGSSQILLLKKIRESLAGRVSIYELWPLLMSEVCGSRLPLIELLCKQWDLEKVFKNIPGVLTDKAEAVCTEAENYLLKWGGMPALLPLSEDERLKWLRDYEYTYLERDLSDLARLNDLEPFRKFQKLSALRSGRLLNYSELARDAAVSVDTAQRYLEYLRLSYQVILIQPYKKNITSSVVKAPKLYWLDIGLLRQLSGYTGELTGEIYETMVMGELIKWFKTTQVNIEPFFYRTKSGMELDVILNTPRGLVAIEIKARKKISSSDMRAIKAVASFSKKDWNGALIIYQGREIKKIAEPNIWAVPSRRLFT